MSSQVDPRLIAKFKKDRARLLYNDIAICKRMGVDRSNYSKAVNQGPITNNFLKKFYDAFGEELRQIKTNAKLPTNKRIEELESRVANLEQFFRTTQAIFTLVPGENRQQS